jgi:hypothetical protein
MSIELDRPGGGVAAFMLSLSTLLALQKNGTLADDELADIVEQSLARLKTIDAATSGRSQAAWGSARTLLEQLHASLTIIDFVAPQAALPILRLRSNSPYCAQRTSRFRSAKPLARTRRSLPQRATRSSP